MRIAINGKHMDVGQALTTHVEQTLQDLVEKYFDDGLDSKVVFTRTQGGQGFRTDIIMHVARDLDAQGRGEGPDAYAAFEQAVGRIGKQLRRYKRRLKSHRGKGVSDDQVLAAQTYVLAPHHDDEEVPETPDHAPVVVAETVTDVPTCTVSDAVMRLDLGAQPLIVFRNSAHDRLNVVYRRDDGHVGWVDPAGSSEA